MPASPIPSWIAGLLPRLKRCANALAGAHDTADDLLQSAVADALGKGVAFDSSSALEKHLHRELLAQWRRERRDRSFRERTNVPATVPQSLEEARQAMETHDDLLRVRDAICTLPERQRLMLSLVVLKGFSYQQVEKALNIPIGTVMSRLARARAALSAKLESAPLSE
jgi:RNA polymerase sigma-70 factor (ECF subfamily)